MRAAVVAIALLASASQASVDIAKLMQIKAMQSRFEEDSLDSDQSKAMMNLAGFEDMQLFYAGALGADKLKESLKQQFKDRMIQNVLTSGGLDITNPFIRKQIFGDKTQGDFFAQSMQEPLSTIMRLARHEEVDSAKQARIREVGKDLLKEYQYKSMNNKNGNAIQQNYDRIFMATDRKEVMKTIMREQFLQSIPDPLDRAMIHFMQKKRTATDASQSAMFTEQIKDMQIIKVLSAAKPMGSPAQSDNMYAFYRMVNGKLEPHQVLDIALNSTKLGPVSELDFERYFGAPAKQFSCRAHESTIRIPCSVRPTAEECVAQGCCWNPEKSGNAPSCFHDLYGKISSSILRRGYIKDQSTLQLEDHIKNLFVDKQIPTIAQLLRDEDPSYAMGLLPNSNNPAVAAPGRAGESVVGRDSTNWWDISTINNEGEVIPSGTNADVSNEAVLLHQGTTLTRPQYGRPGYEWKSHGPTVSPYINNMPGINPTANPSGGTGDINNYYKLWLEFSAKQDEAQCALINDKSRIKCMDNFEFFKSKAITGNTDACTNMGCCYNRDSFLAGNHACYRARDYGTCANLPDDFTKRTCGAPGVSESQCLSDARCCYRPVAEQGVPWCYYRFSATFTEDEWCEAFQLPEHKFIRREPCFDPKRSGEEKSNFFTGNFAEGDGDTSNSMTNINNLVNRDICEKAECCYDDTLTIDAIEWHIEGLDGKGLYRCFRKRNPAAGTHTITTDNSIWDMRQKLLDHSFKGSVDTGNAADELAVYQGPKAKTCNVDKFSTLYALSKIPRSCGENISYHQCVYQLGCCYKPTVTNQPVCYHPDIECGTTDGSIVDTCT